MNSVSDPAQASLRAKLMRAAYASSGRATERSQQPARAHQPVRGTAPARASAFAGRLACIVLTCACNSSFKITEKGLLIGRHALIRTGEFDQNLQHASEPAGVFAHRGNRVL